ncbi:MAG: M1 family metallopeptidase [Chitinophagales bacterium]|nr:M1 family metallopeptidase [Chitinophagales bacterium]
MKKSFLLYVLIINWSLTEAQILYMPRNIKEAIQKGTRSPDGKPGKNYWQNFARYNIRLTINPPDRVINGTEDIVYINNSPDTLSSLVFKLILNCHLAGAIRQFPADSAYLSSGINIDRYIENNVVKKWEVGNGTFQEVNFDLPLLPHDSVKLSMDWHYDITPKGNREGLIDSTTFFLAYFYPRLAVFDDYNGWDNTNFTEAQEFYNDFNDYLLTIEVPENYCVWATGDLLNPEEVLRPVQVKRLKESMTSDSTIHVASLHDLISKNVTAQKVRNTWKWRADYVSDMAVVISDHFAWDASSVIVDDATHRRASVQAVYNDTAKDFHHMVEYGRQALDWLSHKWPGMPYPYQKITVVQGYYDMEYPMLVNDNSFEDLTFARFVAEHEIAHTWFPFYTGINETRYGFMDEGWATTFEYLISVDILGGSAAANFFKKFRIGPWIKNTLAETDLPVITPGNVLSGMPLSINEYGKAALGYLAIKDFLGDTVFKKCLIEFIDRWHGKHPTPWDMFYTFNNISGKNLNWFWSNWFFSNNFLDLSIQSVKVSSGKIAVSIKNIGGFVSPVDIIVSYSDGTAHSFHETPDMWMHHPEAALVKISAKKQVQSVRLDGGIFMDADETNNTWKVK